VDVCVPTFMHAEIAVAALKAGKHVMCEKPMALTVEQCDQVLKAAAGAKGRFMIAQCVRFWPECAFIKQCIEDQRFGKLKAINYGGSQRPRLLGEQLAARSYAVGGAILDLHVHDTDYVLYLLGKPQAVTGPGRHSPGTNAYDRVHSLWHYPNGPVVQSRDTGTCPPASASTWHDHRFDKAAVRGICAPASP